MDLAQQKHAIQLETKLNEALEKNKSLVAQLTGALMKKEEAENNGKLALAKLQEGYKKEVEDIQQKHKDSQETEQRNHDSIVKEIKNELELKVGELTALKGKLQAKEAEVGRLNNALRQKEKRLGHVRLRQEIAERDLIVEKRALKNKETELEIAKENIGHAMEIASELNRNIEARNEDEIELRNKVKGTEKETELRKDSEGLLDWGLFGLKFAVELTLGILEFWANKNNLHILIAAIVLAAFSLTLSVVEIFRCFQRKSIIHNKKVSWVKLPWIPQFYSFIAILGELIFYICKITQRHPVHVSLYTCGFHICLLGKFLTKKYKKSAATREERAARTSGIGGGATVVV